MDFSKKVELYFGEMPVKADESHLQSVFDSIRDSYCAVFVNNDCPADVHNKTMDTLFEKFGPKSKLSKEKGTYIMAYVLDTETGLATMPSELINKSMHKEEKREGRIIHQSFTFNDITADTLRGTKWKAGGFSFIPDIADIVVAELEEQGYEIIKKYE